MRSIFCKAIKMFRESTNYLGSKLLYLFDKIKDTKKYIIYIFGDFLSSYICFYYLIAQCIITNILDPWGLQINLKNEKLKQKAIIYFRW